jgi:hypothetical protein
MMMKNRRNRGRNQVTITFVGFGLPDSEVLDGVVTFVFFGGGAEEEDATASFVRSDEGHKTIG